MDFELSHSMFKAASSFTVQSLFIYVRPLMFIDYGRIFFFGVRTLTAFFTKEISAFHYSEVADMPLEFPYFCESRLSTSNDVIYHLWLLYSLDIFSVVICRVLIYISHLEICLSFPGQGLGLAKSM